MQFYVSNGWSDIPDTVALARAAEAAGIDGLSLSDHLFVPDETKAPYPYSADGLPPFAKDTPWPDVWVLMAALGALTTRLRFLTHVYVLPLRNPLLVAKAGATAAAFAPGRISLGIGVGWMKDEFDALESPFERRGARTNEAITIVRELWSTGEMKAYESEHFSFPAMTMVPAAPMPIPILVGGSSEVVLDRAARLGDGFVCLPHTIEEMGEVVRDLRARVASHGRDPAAFHVNARCTDAVSPEQMAAVEAAGVDSIRVSLWPLGSTTEEKLEAVRRFGAEILTPFRQRPR
jgi:probable F420-dependent oxidoreductase